MDGVQVRKMYSILITLSFCGEESAASGVQDDVHTVIRKQLSHVDPKYVVHCVLWSHKLSINQTI